MQILIYYPKTQKTQAINVIYIDIGVGGLSWVSKDSCGFVGFCPDYIISIVKT